MQFPNGATTKIGVGEEGEPDKKNGVSNFIYFFSPALTKKTRLSRNN